MSTSNLAERLGYPANTRMLIVHCDDIGMSWESNAAAKKLLTEGIPTSGSVMMPCPWAYEFMDWYRDHPDLDVGIHVTLTSEWNTYRWRPLTVAPSLVDGDGFMHKSTRGVGTFATTEEVGQEMAAQIQLALDWGVLPTHVDTHMGASLARLDLATTYLEVAKRYRLSPMILEPGPEPMAELKAQGYDMGLADLMANATTPKLTALYGAAEGKTYDEKKQAVYKQLENLQPGLTYLIIHPALESDNMRAITDSWQQRYWEYKIFMENDTRDKIDGLGIKMVSWQELA